MRKIFAYENKELDKLSKTIIFGNLDEVLFQFNLDDGTTYEFKGSQEVKLLTCNGKKLRMSVLLSILDTGFILPPVIILKSSGKVPVALKEKYKDKFNIDIKDTQKLFLIMDKCPVHIKATIIDFIKKNGSELELIPGGCTGLLQPLDTCVNKPLKDIIRKHFDTWYDTTGSHSSNKTPNGTFRPPKPDDIICWVLEACRLIDKDIIRKSFKHTAINHDLFGSENHLINKRLLNEQEIKDYLEKAFVEKKIDPYDDGHDIEEQIESAPDGVNYEPAEDGDARDDMMEEVNIQENEEDLIEFEFESDLRTYESD